MNLNVISSTCREMADNMQIDIIPANSFQGISKDYVDMWEHYLTAGVCHHLLRMFIDGSYVIDIQFSDLGD